MQKKYSGLTQQAAQAAYDADKDAMEEQGYVPTDSSWEVEDRRFKPDLHHLTVTEPEGPWTGVRVYPSGTVKVNAETPEDAKLAILELKQYKKELALQKKELSAEATAIRAAQAHRVSSRGGMVRGSGTGASMIRGVQRASREAEKAKTANAVGAIANQKSAIDRTVIEVDRLILQLERRAKGLG